MKPCESYIEEQIKKTWNVNPYLEVDNDYLIKKFPSPVYEYDHTDGIGSKGLLHWNHETYHEAVIDALAMNINDLLMKRATPYKLQNHITIPNNYYIENKYKTERAIQSIIKHLSEECIKRQIVMTGGETSVISFPSNELLDISITMSGFALEKFNNCFLEGDKIIGIASSGIHSNGFTTMRKKSTFNKSWLTPTKIYTIPDCKTIHGIQHITGGAFTKFKSKMKDVNLEIHRNHTLNPQKDFLDIYKNIYSGMTNELMYKTFNCGIGMVLSVDPKDADLICKETDGQIIGNVVKGNNKIIIESKFSETTIVL